MNHGWISLALTICLVTISCTEKPVEKILSFGEPAEPKEIQKAIDEAIGESHIYHSKAGQFVEYVSNYRVDLSDPVKVNSFLRTYKGMVENETEIIFQLDEDYYEYNRDGSVSKELHTEVNLKMEKAYESLKQVKTLSESVTADCGRPRKDSDGDEYNCVRYFNFKSVPTVSTPPAPAVGRENCSNIPNCELPARVIYYDQVKYMNEQFVKREKYKIAITNVVPDLFPEQGLPPINYFCMSRDYKVPETSYFVTQCTYLKDLKL